MRSAGREGCLFCAIAEGRVEASFADGEAAFQEVFHVHPHVFPRFAGDPFRISADWRVHDRPALDATAAAVRRGLTALAANAS